MGHILAGVIQCPLFDLALSSNGGGSIRRSVVVSSWPFELGTLLYFDTSTSSPLKKAEYLSAKIGLRN
jgi:hypothetical protein